MKLIMKKTLVAAAIAAMAMSGVAEARIQDGQTGNSELVFSAWDGTLGYTFDLATTFSLNDLVAGGVADPTGTVAQQYVSPSATVAAGMIGGGGIIYDSLLTGLSSFADMGAVQWNLAAADSLSRNRLLTTMGDSAVTMDTSNAKIKNAVTTFNGYVGAANGISTDNVDYLVDGYANSTPADLAGYAGNFGDSWGGYTQDSTSLMGASTTLWVLGMNSPGTTGAAGSATGWINQLLAYNGADITASTYLAQDGWHLQIAAAVPEADTYAMFMAGLGLMGFIARRRMNV